MTKLTCGLVHLSMYRGFVITMWSEMMCCQSQAVSHQCRHTHKPLSVFMLLLQYLEIQLKCHAFSILIIYFLFKWMFILLCNFRWRYNLVLGKSPCSPVQVCNLVSVYSPEDDYRLAAVYTAIKPNHSGKPWQHHINAVGSGLTSYWELNRGVPATSGEFLSENVLIAIHKSAD